MCYSVMVKKDIDELEALTGAIADIPAFKRLKQKHRSNPKKYKYVASDGRIYPKYYAPIIVAEDVGLSIVPMRYSAYPPHYMTQEQSAKLSTFNIRRDAMGKRFWQEAGVGKYHGVIVVNSFYEWVAVKDLIRAGVVDLQSVQEQFDIETQQRKDRILAKGKKYAPTKTELKKTSERDVVIGFHADAYQPLFIPVIYSPDPTFDDKGFAIITDDPNSEILAAGHDRMPLHLKKNQIADWLALVGSDLKTINQFLLKTTKQSFEHQLAS